jgi:WD40 repeat protein
MTRFALCPRGAYLAASGGRQLKVVELDSGRLVWEKRTFGGALTFSSDGSLLAITERRKVCIYDSASGELRQGLVTRHEGLDVAFSPDGALLALVCERFALEVWECGTWSSSVQWPVKMMPGRQTGFDMVDPEALAFLREPGCVVFCGSHDNAACSVDLHRGTVASIQAAPDLGHGPELAARMDSGTASHLEAIAVAPDGRVATASSSGRVQIWNARTWEEALPLTGHDAGANAVAMDPRGRWAATGGQDDRAIVWNIDSGGVVTELAVWGAVERVCFSPDGTRLVAATEGSIHVWRVDDWSRELKIRLTGAPPMVAITPDGQYLVACGKMREKDPLRILPAQPQIHVWNLETGESVAMIDSSTHGSAIACFAGLPYVLLAKDGCVYAYDLYRFQRAFVLTPESGAVDEVRDIAVSPNRRWLATGGWNHLSIRLWDLDQKREVGILDSADDPRGHSSIRALCFLDDRTLVAGGLQSGALTLYDVEQQRLVRTMDAHRGAVSAMAMSEDGSRMATASDDSTALVWNVAELISAAQTI